MTIYSANHHVPEKSNRNLGFHFSNKRMPRRVMLRRKRGLREVEENNLEMKQKLLGKEKAANYCSW